MKKYVNSYSKTSVYKTKIVKEFERLYFKENRGSMLLKKINWKKWEQTEKIINKIIKLKN